MGRLLMISKSVRKLIYYTCVGCNFHSINSANLCFKSTVKYLLSKLHLARMCAHAHMDTHTYTQFSCFDDSKTHVNFCHHFYHK